MSYRFFTGVLAIVILTGCRDGNRPRGDELPPPTREQAGTGAAGRDQLPPEAKDDSGRDGDKQKQQDDPRNGNDEPAQATDGEPAQNAGGELTQNADGEPTQSADGEPTLDAPVPSGDESPPLSEEETPDPAGDTAPPDPAPPEEPAMAAADTGVAADGEEQQPPETPAAPSAPSDQPPAPAKPEPVWSVDMEEEVRFSHHALHLLGTIAYSDPGTRTLVLTPEDSGQPCVLRAVPTTPGHWQVYGFTTLVEGSADCQVNARAAGEGGVITGEVSFFIILTHTTCSFQPQIHRCASFDQKTGACTRQAHDPVDTRCSSVGQF